MATKPKGMKSLIGKQVRIQWRYGAEEEGVVRVLEVDLPFFKIEVDGRSTWWNATLLEGIQEVPPQDESK